MKNLVEEPSVIYGRYSPQVHNNISIVMNARKGVNSKIFYDIVVLSGLKREELADIFHTSLKTIMRYTDTNKNLDTPMSEQALKIMAMFKKGNELFGDIVAFRSWLQRPAFGLGREKPIDMMQTISGIDLIIDELFRIEFGATA